MFINQITLKNIASYDNSGAELNTDKPINLIYGLNGPAKLQFQDIYQTLIIRSLTLIVL